MMLSDSWNNFGTTQLAPLQAYLRFLFAGWGIILLMAPVAGAQTSAYLPVGPGVAVEETPPTSPQIHNVGVACRGAGDLTLAAWSHTSAGIVEGRLFLGQDPLGAQVQISAVGSHMRPIVGLEESGSFVVAWISDSDDTARHRRLDGTTLNWDPEMIIVQPGVQSISLGPDGGFTVTWVEGDLLKGQRYNPVGTALGQVFEVVWPTHDPGVWDNWVGHESVVIDDDGASTLVWASGAVNISNGDSYTSIRAQRFDTSGIPVGNTIDIASAFAPFVGEYWLSVTDPRAEADGAGGFIVLYNDRYWDNDSAIEWDRVRASRYDGDGNPLLEKVFVTERECNACYQRGLSAVETGDFMAMWSGLNACRFPDEGSHCDPAFEVTDHLPVTGSDHADIAHCGSTSDIVAVWASEDCDGGTGYCLWARWFGSHPEIFSDGFETGDPSPWSFFTP